MYVCRDLFCLKMQKIEQTIDAFLNYKALAQNNVKHHFRVIGQLTLPFNE